MSNPEELEQIDVHKAKALIEGGKVQTVDIRDAMAFHEAHISHAISVSDNNVEDFMASADKEKPLICYCYHGISSQGAAQYFKEHGFKEVYSIIGGFEEFQKSYPALIQPARG